uniref:Sodium/chloride cotransporter 3 n=2 Tax=Ascaris TaxID=6251 RepID=F1KS71_ASCSU
MNGNIKRDTPCSIAMSHFVVTPVAEVPNEVSSPPGPEHAAAATVDPVAEHDSDMGKNDTSGEDLSSGPRSDTVPTAGNETSASMGDRETDALIRTTSESGNRHEPIPLWPSTSLKVNTEGNNLALFEETTVPLVSTFLKGFIAPGLRERAESKMSKAQLGVMLGVYLPTIQHILGVTMFIRLFWVVGIAGLAHTFILLALCCICTFLTCVSLSAVATNGEVKSGGAYFMISRNLGAEFGSAVGILFYLANTVAASMYLVGGIEILLIYIFPDLTIGGREVQSETGAMGMMSHNLRLYSTVLLLLEFAIVAMGVRFVQLLAPVSLMCVILSILACYAGGIEKTINSYSGQRVCMLGDHLLQASAILPANASISQICNYCNPENPSPLLWKFCRNNTCVEPLRCINGFPGFGSRTLIENVGPHYMGKDEYKEGRPADKALETFQDVRTTFFVLLAIYFPAVTGILTGANMSGDLANPQSSIPTGTITAQLTTSFIYFSLALCFAAAIDGAVLRDKYGSSLGGGMVVANLAWPSPWVLLIGSFTSTFGAALQCLCSAPRLLQSIAKDDVIPALRPFAKVTKRNEPFIGLILTAVIAEMAILMGAMDQIAAVVDFFFLMCYAFVNLICALHSLLGAPNWRPRFKYYHWTLSLLGAGLCFFIMFSTHWDYALVSCALCIAIYKYVEWKGAKKEWGDGIRGLALSTAQYSLMKIEDKDPHPKNFRPQLLLLFSMPWSRDIVDLRYLKLLHFASQLKAGRGLSIAVAFIRGNPLSIQDRSKAEEVKKRMEFDMSQAKLRGFAKTLVYGEGQITGSLSTLIQSVGIGGLRPNTLLLKWPTYSEERSREAIDSEYQTFTEKLLAGVAMDMCLLVAKGIIDFPVPQDRLAGYVDVYWIVQDGGLCILISYLLQQHKVWKGCKLRVIAIAQEKDNNLKMETELKQYVVYQLRVRATILVVDLADPQISKTAFERTLLMEQRTRYNLEMHSLVHRPLQRPSVGGLQFMAERQSRFEVHKTHSQASLDGVLPNGERGSQKDEEANEHSTVTDTISKKSRVMFASGEEEPRAKTPEEVAEIRKELKALDRSKVHKMHTAVRLNEIIIENSLNSQLVLLNLPKPPIRKEGLEDYIHYLEVLTDNVKRVLFVRGTGQEVITTTS